MRMPLLYTIVVSLTLMACRESPSTQVLTEDVKAQIAAEVEAAANIWWSAWQTMDFELGMSFISDRPEAVWVGDDGILYGEAQMREAWRRWAAGISEQSNDRTEVRFVILTPDIAYVTLKFTGATTTTSTGSVIPERSVFETLVWVKEEGEWKIMVGHESVAQESWQTVLDLR